MENCLIDLVGFEQTKDPCIPLISDDLVAPIYKFEFENSVVNHKALYESLVSTDSLAWEFWDVAESYAIGARVVFDGKVYIGLLASTGAQPDLNPTDWGFLYDLPNYSEQLSSARRSSVQRTLQDVMQSNYAKFNKRAIVERACVETGGDGDRKPTPLATDDNFIFWEIYPKDISTKLKIQSLALFFNQSFVLPIYFFDTNQDDPIFQIDAESVAFKVSRNTIDFEFLPLASNSKLVFGYYADDLPVGAIPLSKKVDNSGLGCKKCLGHKNHHFNFVWAKVGSVSDVNFTKGFLPELEQSKKLDPFTFGLDNFCFSVYCNYEPFICEHSELLVPLIRKKFAIDVIERILTNPNSRGNQTVTPERVQQLVYVLDGNEHKSGLRSEYKQALEAFSFNFSGYKGACYPCTQPSFIVSTY